MKKNKKFLLLTYLLSVSVIAYSRPPDIRNSSLLSTRTTYVQTDYGTDSIEGLKYINDKVLEYLEIYNQAYNTNWSSLEPDARVMVYKCSVPLQAKWSKKHHFWMREEGDTWSVEVFCAKTTNTVPENKEWSVLVPTTRPIGN